VGDSLERHIRGALLLTSFHLILLLLGDWSLSFLLFFSRCCSIFSTTLLLIFLLILGGDDRRGSTGLNRNFLLLGPMFSHFDALKFWDLVDVVLDADSKLSKAAWHISVRSLAFTDVILGDRLWKTGHEGGSSRLVIADRQRHLSFLVVEFKGLDERELLAEREEVLVHLWLLSLIGDWVRELIVDRDWQVVVIVHRKRLNREVGGHHGGVEGGASCDAIERVEGSLELLLLEDLLDDGLHNRGAGSVTNQLDELDLVGSQF